MPQHELPYILVPTVATVGYGSLSVNFSWYE